jgi:hypothetical protein
MKWLGENDKWQAEIHLPVALGCKRSHNLKYFKLISLTPGAGDLMQCRVRVIRGGFTMSESLPLIPR